MTPADRHLTAVLLQAKALKEQATALGMQAETLERTVTAILAQPVAPEAEPASTLAPERKKYLNGYQPPSAPTPPAGDDDPGA